MLHDKRISLELLTRFNEFISTHIGLHFTENRREELERGANETAKEFGFSDTEACINWLMNSSLSRAQVEILSTYLTVGETYFFRDNESFDMLERNILPILLAHNGQHSHQVRVWSAACSSGEEVYTLAIIFNRFKKNFDSCDVHIMGTDINRKALKKAETGIYSEWSFRNTPNFIKTEYFNRIDKNSYQVKPHIKEMVRFCYLNLAEDAYPSLINDTNGIDIVFCRNVLMYFSTQKATEVVDKLYRSLVKGGWLFVAPTDSFHVINRPEFQRDPNCTGAFCKEEKKEESGFFSIPVFPQQPPVTNFPITNPLVEPNREQFQTSMAITEKETKEIFEKTMNYYKQKMYSRSLVGLEKLAVMESKGLLPPVLQKETGNIYASLARAYANIGRLSDAASSCQKALDIEKLNPSFRYLDAVINMERGNEENAVKSLKKCLYADPNYILAHFTMGNILQRQNQKEDALRHFKIAQTLLEQHQPEDIVSEEEGLTAGRLREVVRMIVEKT